MFHKQTQEMFYKKAKRPEDLPWHRDEPDGFLVSAVKLRGKPGKALDLGFGSGVFSVYLAKQGYDVTAIDYMPRALEMAKERSAREGVKVNWVSGNLLEWNHDGKYDLVLDSGCLHSLIGTHDPKLYKAKLLSWLKPGADYILGHFGKRGFFDWRPIGPTRRTRKELVELFQPELKLMEYEQEVFETPFPIGPTVMGQGFWFKAP